LHSRETFADRDLDDASDSTKIRAEIENPPVEMPGFEGKAYFNNLHAESDIHATTPEVLAVPRSAVLYRGREPMVYVADGGGHYTTKAVTLGRVGDEYYEVRSGLDEGDVVVTHGALLIDAEAQLSEGR
jgi:Cu(I)/Ag(I) efflux system membrane fusion protein